tara:strand:- start:359 stop:1255 length:897 start_codon:yes stop_codon:yes gene_type:complete
MGAYPLEDHKMIHRQFGIKRLIAFDIDQDTVARQIFNKPIESCKCLTKKSGEIITELDRILEKYGYETPDGIIFWLDYTNPRQIGHQIREFQTLIDKLTPGDIVRITVNAHAADLLEDIDPEAPPMKKDEKRKKQFENLKSRIGEFLPAKASADDMTPELLPILISRSFAKAALKAYPVNGDTVFTPLSIVRYADGQQMLSITGTLTYRNTESDLITKMGLESWPFTSSDWSTIHHLVVPSLTMRERLVLERGISTKNSEELIKDLGFEAAGDIKVADFLQSYRDYYRFYPTLLTAEV